MVQIELINLEICNNCSNNSLKFNITGNKTVTCEDIFHIISILIPHFQHLKTLQRLMYEIRSMNFWILQFVNIIKIGSYKQIESFISTTPIRVT